MGSGSNKSELSESDATDEKLYLRRREIIKQGGLFGLGAAAWGTVVHTLASRNVGFETSIAQPRAKPSSGPFVGFRPAPPIPGEPATSLKDITSYNNFYELGLAKSDPAREAHRLRLRPWSLRIDGEVHKPKIIGIDALIKRFPLSERIYRMRCVEAWSMVIPWLGFPLRDLVAACRPKRSAKYVVFTTLYDPERLPGQRRNVLNWPYVEGLRIDEATHPLTWMALGIYGSPLLGQNGAPLRLVVPWKYGFKGIKSIVRMSFVRSRPKTSWNRAAPNEYGFYANVNPKVAHPRWSQASERRIGTSGRIPTRPFNGYASQVAGLYRNMDLSRFF